MTPAVYLKTFKNSKCKEKIEFLRQMLSQCRLCPRRCGVNRLEGQRGFCGAGKTARVSSAFAHFGEESCLVGDKGSGTIFFAYCNLKCIFCQNYEVSHLAEGKDISCDQLAAIMLRLQNIGCHNINLVTPTHFIPQIIEALQLAIEGGLGIPLIYNCGGYESLEVIDKLEGLIDIYMPDTKFTTPQAAEDFSRAGDYFPNLKLVLKKMHRQVGDLEITGGIARKGLLVRHLVMPHGLAGTEEIMRFICEELSTETYINIMDQYRPLAEAFRHESINRPITSAEYQKAKDIAASLGLHRFDK